MERNQGFIGRVEYRTLDLSFLDELTVIERECQESPWSTSLIERELKSPRTIVEGMFLEEKLVAYVVYQIVVDEVHVLNFGVRLAHRRRGLGTLFMLDLIQRLRTDGATSFMLEVRAGNDVALRLYRSIGFNVEGRREKYYSSNGEDALLMTLRI